VGTNKTGSSDLSRSPSLSRARTLPHTSTPKMEHENESINFRVPFHSQTIECMCCVCEDHSKLASPRRKETAAPRTPCSASPTPTSSVSCDDWPTPAPLDEWRGRRRRRIEAQARTERRSKFQHAMCNHFQTKPALLQPPTDSPPSSVLSLSLDPISLYAYPAPSLLYPDDLPNQSLERRR
jgi:hypothetical protein